MGADGTWQLMRREDFAAEWPDIDASTIGLRAVVVLGVEAYGRYWDTSDRDDFDYAPAVQLAENHDRTERYLTWFDPDSPVSPNIIITGTAPNRIGRHNYFGTFNEATLRASLAEAAADPAALAASQRALAAQHWFENHAEDRTVWT